MRRSKLFLSAAVALCFSGPFGSIHAAIVADGDVEPDPETTPWTSSTRGYVGKTADGSLAVNGGSNLASSWCYLGYESTGSGVATISGDGSTWTNEEGFYVGYYGEGTLVVVDGGDVNNGDIGVVGARAGSVGTVTIRDAGSTWSVGSTLAVGSSGKGTLTIASGAAVSSMYASVGSFAGSVGRATVTGADSSWTNEEYFSIGRYGDGMLAIVDGGEVRSSDSYVGRHAGSMGAVALSGANSSWSTGVPETGMSGHGYIGHDFGATGEVAVRAGASWTLGHDLYVGRAGSGTLMFAGGTVSNDMGYVGCEAGSTGQVTVAGAGSTWNNDYSLFIGRYGNGTLTITNGGKVVNTYWAAVGAYAGSTGVAKVAGAGSTWTSNAELYVGGSGRGSLAIDRGGAVANTIGYLGTSLSSIGSAWVSGSDSTWTNSGNLYVGSNAKGMLALSNGGRVAASGVIVNSQSLMAIEVSNGSRLTVGTGAGAITNDGTIRIMAGATPTTGTVCTPIVAGDWTTGSGGVLQVIGGTWVDVDREFTVSIAAHGTSGSPVSIDLASTQRVLIDHPATGWSIGASFLVQESSTPLDFTATVVGGEALASLESLLESNERILGGWQFSVVGGYNVGEPAYLSLAADVGRYTRDDVQVWRYADGGWSTYDPWDLTCDGTYASFTVADFSGYAVTIALVPGDTDGDNDVDQDDAAALAAHWGQSGGWADGDFNGDGAINAADASILAANWNPATPSEEDGPLGSVPEPGAIALLAGLGVGAVLLGRQGKGRGPAFLSGRV